MPSKRKTNGSMLQAKSKQDGQIVRQLAALALAKQPSKKRKGAKKNGQKVGMSSSAFARMISDPCNAPLVPGLYGTHEGYLSRFHATQSVQASSNFASSSCGVMLWCPKFHNPGLYGSDITTLAGTVGAEYNLIVVQADSGSSLLDFTGFNISGIAGSVTPGASFNDTRSISYPDPSWSFVNGSTCSAARTLSACVRMSYSGQVSTAQGMVAHIDVPLSYILDQLPSGGSYQSTATVDGFFNGSQKVQRMSLDTVEQKWIPSEDGLFLSAPTAGVARDTDADLMISAVKGVTPGSTTLYTTGRYSAVNNPRVIGFAWRGLAPNTAQSVLQFDLYKNIEWKPESQSGITVPRSVRTAVVPPVQAAVVALDARGTPWTQSVMHEVESAASKMAKSALAYSGQLVMKGIGF